MVEKIKITKADLKRNELAEFLKKIVDYFIINREKLQIVIIAAVIVLIAIPVIYKIISNKVKKSEAIYTDALMTYNQGLYKYDSDLNTSIQKFESVIKTYKKTLIAKISNFNIADAYYRMGNYEKAELYYNKFIMNGIDEFIPYAELSLAKINIQKKEYEKALNKIDKILKKNSDSYVKSELLLYKSIALLRLKKIEEAISILNQIDSKSKWFNYFKFFKTYYKHFSEIKDKDYVFPETLVEKMKTAAVEAAKKTDKSDTSSVKNWKK